ncbi:BdrN protein [Veillonella parvula]|uniref:BdrN protein n=1 Tax=Veillonella parvula TaxID=29466 RepID=UPI001656DF8F|nr:BdrN protein [Veillonella parvula]
MVWLKPTDYKKQEYIELRLNALLGELIRLDFNPLKINDISNSSPSWKDWHCYRNPLRVYSPDFDILVSYFNQVYPIIDASDNTESDRFDVCFDNWIKQDDWIKIIHNIEVDLINSSKEEQEFLNTFIDWIKEVLQHTSVIVVEGNL